jgi:hypothetical protein
MLIKFFCPTFECNKNLTGLSFDVHQFDMKLTLLLINLNGYLFDPGD